MQLQPINTAETDMSIPGNTLVEREYSVAVTGDAFRWLIDFGNEDVLNKVSGPCTNYFHFFLQTNVCCIGACMRQSVCAYVPRRETRTR